jgi:hypothetical protein
MTPQRQLLVPPVWDDGHEVLVWMEDVGGAVQTMSWAPATPAERARAERFHAAANGEPHLSLDVVAAADPTQPWLAFWRCPPLRMYVKVIDLSKPPCEGRLRFFADPRHATVMNGDELVQLLSGLQADGAESDTEDWCEPARLEDAIERFDSPRPDPELPDVSGDLCRGPGLLHDDADES